MECSQKLHEISNMDHARVESLLLEARVSISLSSRIAVTHTWLAGRAQVDVLNWS